MCSSSGFKTKADFEVQAPAKICSENGAGPTRDELDIEFLGNRTGQPYLIQTNVSKNGTGNREMRHQLWFDPTEDFHSYSILWNSHQILSCWKKVLVSPIERYAVVPDDNVSQKDKFCRGEDLILE
ncbi:unnamed protein product [Camellia sinensis]